jgi:hypothetical protein
MNSLRALVAALAAVFSTPLLVCGCRTACEPWEYVKKTGKVEKKRVDEASGLVMSRKTPGVLWTLNDEAGDTRLFALDLSGDLVAQAKLARTSIDWEDLAPGPCAGPGEHCLYIADTGGSKSGRAVVQILRLAEPVWQSERSPRLHLAARDVEVAEFRYVDGKARDAEALIVDASGTLWLFDKHDKRTTLFKAAFSRGLTPGAKLHSVADRGDIERVTAADLNADGSRFILRDDDKAYEFSIPSGGDVASGFRGDHHTVELERERQGEAIAYDVTGNRFFTLSEGKREPIFRYDRRPCAE